MIKYVQKSTMFEGFVYTVFGYFIDAKIDLPKYIAHVNRRAGSKK